MANEEISAKLLSHLVNEEEVSGKEWEDGILQIELHDEHTDDNKSVQDLCNELADDDEILEFMEHNPKSLPCRRVKFLAVLLLAASLSLGIYITVLEHGYSLTSKDGSFFLKQFINDTKDLLENDRKHGYSVDYPTGEERESHKQNSTLQHPDLRAVAAHTLLSMVDLIGIMIVLVEHFDHVQVLVGCLPFLHIILAGSDYSQQLTAVRLVVESIAMMTLIWFLQKIKPLQSKPLFPCSCDPDQYFHMILCGLIPCSSCTCCCCSKENTDRTDLGPRYRLEMFRIGTSAAILTSFIWSISTFHSLYTYIDEHNDITYGTAVIMNSFVSIYGFVALLKENYRSLSGHASLSITCAGITGLLAQQLTPSAAWLLLPLSMSAFSVYILTCLMRIFYDIKDGKPYAALRLFILLWQVSTIYFAPMQIAASFSLYTTELAPVLIFSAVSLPYFILHCSVLYGTYAEKYVLLDKCVIPIVLCVIFNIIIAVLIKFVFYTDSTIPIIKYVVGYIIAIFLWVPFNKIYVIELKLFNEVMTEEEIWYVYRQVRKLFNKIKVVHTVADVCVSVP